MKPSRLAIHQLAAEATDDQEAVVAGRVVALSPATLALEDMTDRRSFSFLDAALNKTRLRVGDVAELTLRFTRGGWRVSEVTVLVPCTLDGAEKQAWMKRWLRQGDRLRRNLELRSRLFAHTRAFFASRNFLEVQTPTLVPCPGMEPNLEGFATTWHSAEGAFARDFFLPTSPEFHLKKMLALGYERLFEFSRSFRNEPASPNHQPEFTMLEWYRAYSGYEAIMDDLEQWVAMLAELEFGAPRLVRGERTIDLTPPWVRISVRDLFLERFGIDLDLITDARGLIHAARSRGYAYVQDGESFDDTFFRLFLTEIEPTLGYPRPVILYDYPIEMAALARRKPGAPRYAERFEVYLNGLELGNAFGELNQATEQARRFEQFAEESQAARGFHYEPDREFLDALRFGMPPAGGIAVGFDRLVMLFAGEPTLENVIAFPHPLSMPVSGDGNKG